MFAEIAVHTPMARRPLGGARPESGAGDAPLGVTFHYRVPEAMAGALRPGHRFWHAVVEGHAQG
ncbi:MAG: hypothetical protein IAE85_20855, partial [Anaerolinea sp.]|nr:hypothetical protein [Anaerolinea sp.]